MNQNRPSLIRILTNGVVGLALIVISVLYIWFLIWRGNIEVALPGDSHVASTPAGEIEYVLHGNGERVILMLHGTPGTHTHLNPEILTDAGYSVLMVARPGYSRTPLETGKSPEEQADAYSALLDYLDIEEVVVMGISGGGPSALQFALRHPDKTEGIVMYGAVSMAIELATPRLADRITRTEFGLWIASNWVKWRAKDENHRKIAAYYQRTLFPVSAVEKGLENDLLNLESLPVYPLSEIPAPVLILHGTEDRVVLFSHGHFVHLSTPNSQLIRLEGAAHDGLITDFDQNMLLVLDWLRDMDAQMIDLN